jgi:hypothetical protein
MADDASTPSQEKTVGRAAFLGGLLAFSSLVALSVIGVGHSRSLEGSANAQYWIVVALTAAVLAAVAAGLARTPARTSAGEAARRIGVALAALWLVIFLWEAVAIGGGAFAGPFELGWAALKG